MGTFLKYEVKNLKNSSLTNEVICCSWSNRRQTDR